MIQRREDLLQILDVPVHGEDEIWSRAALERFEDMITTRSERTRERRHISGRARSTVKQDEQRRARLAILANLDWRKHQSSRWGILAMTK